MVTVCIELLSLYLSRYVRSSAVQNEFTKIANRHFNVGLRVIFSLEHTNSTMDDEENDVCGSKMQLSAAERKRNIIKITNRRIPSVGRQCFSRRACCNYTNILSLEILEIYAKQWITHVNPFRNTTYVPEWHFAFHNPVIHFRPRSIYWVWLVCLCS